MPKLVPLTQGKFAIVDDEDALWLSNFKWRISRNGYAMTGSSPVILMHREILRAPIHLHVDHINGDRLDNRKSNLRLVTAQQNHFNRSSHKGTSSRFKGVYWEESRKKWRAHIEINGKAKKLGRFDDEIEAALAYNRAAIQLFGEHARLNQIEERCLMATDNNATKVITGKVRLSYAHIFEPRQDDQGENKYSTSILIPKSDKETLRKIKAAVDAAIELGKSKWNGKIPPNLKKPLRDGDEERPDDEAYAGHYFLNATSKNKPGIAKPIGKGADGKTKFQEITDSTEVYSGCYAKVSLNFYPFDAKGNRGVAAGLNNVVKVQDGDFLGGRANVNDDFADEEFDDDYADEDEDFLS